MLDWLRRWFKAKKPVASPSPSANHGSADSLVHKNKHDSLRLSDLYVEPDVAEDFDKDACERLIATLARRVEPK